MGATTAGKGGDVNVISIREHLESRMRDASQGRDKQLALILRGVVSVADLSRLSASQWYALIRLL